MPSDAKLPDALEKLLEKWELVAQMSPFRRFTVNTMAICAELRAAWPRIEAQVRLEEAKWWREETKLRQEYHDFEAMGERIAALEAAAADPDRGAKGESEHD